MKNNTLPLKFGIIKTGGVLRFSKSFRPKTQIALRGQYNSVYKESFRNCCGIFKPKDIFSLASNTEFSERVLRHGFCPVCSKYVVEVSKRRYTGEWVHEIAKRNKALKLFEKYKSDIIGEFDRNVKHGTKANMAFRYGLNIEEKDRKGKKIIKRYAIDFNGTKELLKV